jgi:hypothetical protein
MVIVKPSTDFTSANTTCPAARLSGSLVSCRSSDGRYVVNFVEYSQTVQDIASTDSVQYAFPLSFPCYRT